MFVDGIEFEEYEVSSVKLILNNCLCEIEVIFHKDKRRLIRKKIYTIQTNCDVNINEEIKKLEEQLNGTNILS